MNGPNNSSVICVDASLVLRMALGGPYRSAVRELWSQWVEQGSAFIAPPLFAFEVTSTLWQNVYHHRISLERGQAIFENIFEQGITLEYPPDLHRHAWQIAQQFNLHAAYDAHYVALAQQFKCEFWTMDVRCYQALHKKLPWVKTVADPTNK
ncbi:MAG: type II toxin-antitoxin system VapC family toxin [Anaerolineae bacterium]|nr:type II toxin-antitoxin system VapC family toxin [Anaerolineae bacterium]